jgi:hypothetical protein
MKIHYLQTQADRNLYAESDEERQARKEVEGKLMAMGMLPKGQPVRFKEFKERIQVSRYGKRPLYIIFIGDPKHNMFGFYPEITTKAQAIKDAYASYKRLVRGDLSDIEYGTASWGDGGYPISYGKIRKVKWGVVNKV